MYIEILSFYTSNQKYKDTKNRNQLFFYYGEHLTVAGIHFSILGAAGTFCRGFVTGRLTSITFLAVPRAVGIWWIRNSRDFAIRFNPQPVCPRDTNTERT